MSQAHLGSFSGAAIPGVNMLDIFKENEKVHNKNSFLNFCEMTIKKIGISCPAGTTVKINGKEITMFSGSFELGMDQIDVSSLIFDDAVDVNIYYMF